ncbi:MAG: hypothetical protein JAY67_17055 [Candidatus Thiodiazotropha taylori]|nr:hypothetical protein [Candidatus Thiodiazotropha taylori]MCG7971482.1 hypothetical protein [Candidatus Thiodiazotropha taylori]
MIPDDPNAQMVEGLIKYLSGITDEFVLIGGCATGLLITEPTTTKVRPTIDVDLVASLATRMEYEQIADKLRERGFVEDSTSDVICRWKIGSFLVDIIPTEENVFGFGNAWYKEAYNTASKEKLPSGEIIRLISSPYFLATKIIAFHNRGNGDYSASHDIEDIITVLNGRKEIVDEVQTSTEELQEFLREEFEALLLEPAFTDAVSWHLLPDDISQARLPEIFQKFRVIAQL